MATDISITVAEKINATHKTTTKEATGVDPLLTKLFGEYDFNRYGIIGAVLVIVVCLGGLGVAVGAMTSPLQIMVIVIPTMLCLSLVLAVAPMKLVLYSGITSIIVSSGVIVLNLLA